MSSNEDMVYYDKYMKYKKKYTDAKLQQQEELQQQEGGALRNLVYIMNEKTLKEFINLINTKDTGLNAFKKFKNVDDIEQKFKGFIYELKEPVISTDTQSQADSIWSGIEYMKDNIGEALKTVLTAGLYLLYKKLMKAIEEHDAKVIKETLKALNQDATPEQKAKLEKLNMSYIMKPYNVEMMNYNVLATNNHFAFDTTPMNAYPIRFPIDSVRHLEQPYITDMINAGLSIIDARDDLFSDGKVFVVSYHVVKASWNSNFIRWILAIDKVNKKYKTIDGLQLSKDDTYDKGNYTEWSIKNSAMLANALNFSNENVKDSMAQQLATRLESSRKDTKLSPSSLSQLNDK